MKLGFPELEKAIRQSARSEMRSNKVLWKDYKRHRKGWLRRKLAGNNKVIAMFSFIWMGLVAAARGQGG